MFLVAILLISAVFPFAVVATGFKAFYKNNPKEAVLHIGTYLRNVAFSLDQTGNVMFSDLWNLILITKDGYKFGNPDETISSVLGRNQLKGTLTQAGKALVWILDKIEKDHSIKAIGN